MKTHRWWSIALSVPLLAAMLTVIGPVAEAQSGPRIVGQGPEGAVDYAPRSMQRRPGLIDPRCGSGLPGDPAIGAAACDPQLGREWEGIAATNYFDNNPDPTPPAAPNPDIAVGPDDIITVVGKVIARYENPNAPQYNNNGGAAPVPYSPSNSVLLPPSSRSALDVWIGEAALNALCPTQPRSNLSCQIENASVRYDQMQGRFVVLFTVVDTGLVNLTGAGQATPPAASGGVRKASWVLIVSRWATGCQGTGGGFSAACVPNTMPAVPGGFGNTEFFSTPQPPGTNQANPNSGGLNGNWLIYYGSTGGASAFQGDDGVCPTNGCLYGNINTIADLQRGATFAGAPAIDCRVTAIGSTGTVCYFPSSARLGIDNDNLTIVSSVYDDNIPLAARTIANPAFMGSRIRVLKKAAIYTGVSSVASVVNPAPPAIPAPFTACPARPLCPGGSQSNLPGQLQGDFYDLWVAGSPYTVDRAVAHIPPGGTAPITLYGLQYEPVHVRGRSLASYNGNANNPAFTNLVGAIFARPYTANERQTRLYVRTITFTTMTPGNLAANQLPTTPVVGLPRIQGGIPALAPETQTVTVPLFANADTIIQRNKLAQPAPNNTSLPTPWLFVGDNRPQRVISREGHLYDARAAIDLNSVNFNSVRPYSTVYYDIIQKLSAASAPALIYNTKWVNGYFYAPMFDVPANVIQYGSISPINTLPYLEKLFVGTTYPPLSPSDPRPTSGRWPYIGQSTALQNICKYPSPSVTSAGIDGDTSYPGLFDMRCGEDAYDTPVAYRQPVTGAFTPDDFGLIIQPPGFPVQIVPMGVTGGAATDPNNLGLWLYGAYAKGRLSSIPGFGQWGTYVAHYPLSFPIRDPYNNLNQGYADVGLDNPHYIYLQIARQTEISPGARRDATFRPNDPVKRKEMATWVIRAQMDEVGITNYLNSTGGFYCSFADVDCPSLTPGATVTDVTGAALGGWRYIEAMYRRGITKGCSDTNDGQRRFCPERTLTRGEMAVFLVRAKMNSVFPTVVSGAFTTTTCQPAGTTIPAAQIGDLFGLYYGCRPYFSDVPPAHPYFGFIQKLRELRITNGTTLTTPSALGTFEASRDLTRGELMVFIVRAFLS